MASNKEIVEQYLRGKGLNDKAIAGIMGNIQMESNFQTDVTNSKSGAYGLFQWLGERKTRLKQYALEQGKTSDDIYTQLDFFWYELNTTEKKTKDAMLSGDYSTPSEYAVAFEKLFERSGGGTNAKRKKYAETIYGELGAGSISGGYDVVTPSNPNSGNGLNWWGDIVITVFAIMLVVMGVVFIGLAVTSNKVGSSLVGKVKGVVENE